MRRGCVKFTHSGPWHPQHEWPAAQHCLGKVGVTDPCRELHPSITLPVGSLQVCTSHLVHRKLEAHTEGLWSLSQPPRHQHSPHPAMCLTPKTARLKHRERRVPEVTAHSQLASARAIAGCCFLWVTAWRLLAPDEEREAHPRGALRLSDSPALLQDGQHLCDFSPGQEGQ